MDIIEELRDRGKYSMNSHGADMILHFKAAKEIDRLRKEVKQQSDNYARALRIISSRDRDICELKQEIENLLNNQGTQK